MVEANAIGNWSEVGYTGPGTSSANGSATGVFQYIETAPSNNTGTLWKAKALQKLNDCEKGKQWGLYVAISGSEEDGQTNAVYNVGDDDASDYCLALTPSFDKLISGRSTATAAF